MSDIKWIKVTVDMFEDSKIEFLRSLPEGDSVIVIWLQLLSLAGKSNADGYLMITEGIPYTEQVLSNTLRRNPVLLQYALETFLKLKMINVEDGPFHITKWEKHQSAMKMEEIKSKSALKQAAYRERQKAKQLLLQESNEKVTKTVTRYVTNDVTKGNSYQTDIELELELDKEKSIKDIVVKHDIPYSEIIDYLNEKAGTKYKSNTKATKEHINARYKEGFTIDDFKLVIDKKCAEWIGTTYEQYLRPNTLFIAGKFESYVNQSYTSSSTSVVGRTGQAAYRVEPPIKTLAQHRAEEEEKIQRGREERKGWIS